MTFERGGCKLLESNEGDVLRKANDTAASADRASPLRASPPRVLIIDDESTLRVALRRFFVRMGWEVTEAGDGKEALALLLESVRPGSKQPGGAFYDMVLSDVRMPGLNGMQLHARLKAERPDIVARLVFSTGDVSAPETAAFARDVGCVIVHKPFQLSELQRIAEDLARTQQQELSE